jgi:hypothetical protein
MKKEYYTPQTTVVDIRPSRLLADSDPSLLLDKEYPPIEDPDEIH